MFTMLKILLFAGLLFLFVKWKKEEVFKLRTKRFWYVDVDIPDLLADAVLIVLCCITSGLPCIIIINFIIDIICLLVFIVLLVLLVRDSWVYFF